MDAIAIFLSSMLLGLIFYLTMKYFARRSREPPGPISLPFIGHLHLVRGENPHETINDLSKKYGPILRIDFGQFKTIVISDFSTAKKVLIKQGAEFGGRMRFLTGDLLSRGGKNIILSDYGKGWKFHRKVAHSALRMFGEGMNKLEGIINYEVEELCKRIEKFENVIFDPAVDINLTVMNIICKMLFGGSFERRDPEFIKFKEHLQYFATEGGRFQLYDVIPVLQWLPWKKVEIIKEMKKEIDEFLLSKLETERSTVECQRSNAKSHVLSEDIKMTNYIQHLLKAKREAEEEDTDLQQYLTDDHLISTMFDLFVAGSETTATTIKWCLLYLVNWPDIQEKVQMILDEEFGKPDGVKVIPLSMKPELPYLEAVIMETQRLASIVPLGLFHKAMKDTTLEGYDVPKETGIVINHWAIHHDESYWKDPFYFDPTRFLDTNGKIVRDSSRHYIPFSAGTRVCLGETLARTELFLCLSNLFYRFRFTFPSTEEKANLQGKSKITLCPNPYRIISKKRY